MKHYSVLQFNLLSLANELDNFPAGDDHPYQCLDKYPDRIMRKDVCDELLPVGSKTLLEPPSLPICSNCAREQVRSAYYLPSYHYPHLSTLPTNILLYLLYLPLSSSIYSSYQYPLLSYFFPVTMISLLRCIRMHLEIFAGWSYIMSMRVSILVHER